MGIKKIKDFLTKDKWMQGAYAKSAYNLNVSIDSPQAVKWCLFSAVIKCYPFKEHKNILNKLTLSIKKLFNVNLTPTQFNDQYKYEDVLKVIEDANV